MQYGTFCIPKQHEREVDGSKFCRYVEVCKKDSNKGIYGKFMIRKPGIHGQYKAEEEKAWYNTYKDFM